MRFFGTMRFLTAAILATGLTGPRPGFAAPVREIVIANEVLVQSGPYLESNLTGFLRHLEKVVGWPTNSLKGKAFTRPADALAYIKKNKVSFAILPTHQFLEGRKELKFEVLGRAVGMEGDDPTIWGVSRNEKLPYEHIEDYPGLRLGMTEIGDLQWINVLLEGRVDPSEHFKLTELKTGPEAIAALLAKKVDVVLLNELDFQAIKPRLKNDLLWVYASAPIPASPILAVGKWANLADQKKLAAVAGSICNKDGGPACARLGILYTVAGGAGLYKNLIEKYDTYR